MRDRNYFRKYTERKIQVFAREGRQVAVNLSNNNKCIELYSHRNRAALTQFLNKPIRNIFDLFNVVH